MKIALLFPGQGSHYIGMGKDFYDSFATARKTFEEADDLLHQRLSSLIFFGNQQELTQTKNAQLSIFVTSIAFLRTLQELTSLTPSFTLGLSLGEYTALHAAKILSFSDALKLVSKRASFMEEACLQKNGAMSAVLGLSSEEIKEVLPSSIWVANLNCPGQVVISGAKELFPLAEERLLQKGAKRLVPLQVAGAFHCPFMQSAKEKLEDELKNLSLSPSSIFLVMNTSGQIEKDLPRIKKLMSEQVVSPVLWEASIRTLEQENIDLYIEIGCGKTLTGMNRKIGIKGRSLNLEKVEDLRGFNA